MPEKENLYASIFEALNIDENSLVFDLTQIPKDNKTLHHQAYSKNYVQQADLLFLPEDQGYRYALVVVDVANKKADAEPIKDKQPKTVEKAMKKIWARPYINKPKAFLQVDDGTEFKGVFTKFIEDNNIVLMRGKPGRSRSLAVAEHINLVIGKSIMLKQTNDELAEEEENTEWVDELPTIVRVYNKFIDKQEEKRIQLSKPSRQRKMYKAMKNIEVPDDLLEVGQKVYIPLDKPQNIKNKRLAGAFRAGDLRYEPKPREITDVLLGSPTAYHVQGLPTTVYTREMLLLDEGKQAIPTKEKYTVEKIVGKRKRNNRIEYKIKWLNYPASENTWEERKELIKSIPQLIQEYEEQ